MYCTNCGKEIPDGSLFCDGCGAKVADAAPEVAQAATKPEAKPKAPAKPVNPLIFVAIGVVALIAIVAIVLVATHKHKVDLNKYASISFDGVDGYGTAEVVFEEDEFLQEIAKYDKSLKKNSDLSSLTSLIASLTYLNIGKKLDKEENLKNGDEVKLTFTYDNKLAAKHGIKFVGSGITRKVEGLKEVESVNPFDYVTVSFSGTAPYATASYERTDDAPDYMVACYFSFDKSSDLSKGDTVTLSATDFDTEYFANHYGVTFSETSKTYTCDGIQSHVASSADITDAFIADLQGQTKDVIESYFAKNDEYIKQDNLSYCGYYLLVNKSSNSSSNMIYMIYSANVSSKEKEFKKTTVYFPVRFDGLVQNSDGTVYCDNFTSAQISSGKTDLECGWGYVQGYTKVSEMKNDLITSYKGEYNTEIVGDVIQ